MTDNHTTKQSVTTKTNLLSTKIVAMVSAAGSSGGTTIVTRSTAL